jgi:hypothetical protein
MAVAALEVLAAALEAAVIPGEHPERKLPYMLFL